ncbi:MAG: hypothetical protein PHE27_05250 [Alphaproteobacteria bacterium]|nr:hypothetical protein [Alphaproteobacteria bacterium]
MIAPESQSCDIGAFVETVRKKQRESGKALCGCFKLSPETIKAIKDASRIVFEIAPSNGLTCESMTTLMMRFEELCRRQEIAMPASARIDVLRYLVSELIANHTALGGNPNKLIAVTLYRGAVGPRIVAGFPMFSETPGILRHATEKNPSDPEKFLRNVNGTIDALAAQNSNGQGEFSCFSDTPWVFKHAAVHNLSDPERFLRGLKQTIDTLKENSKNTDDEFSCFSDTPGIFKYAAVHHLSNPQRFLRDVKKTMNYLIEESKKPGSEFASLANMPGMFRAAAIGHPSNPEAFLRKVLKERVCLRLMQSPEEIVAEEDSAPIAIEA